MLTLRALLRSLGLTTVSLNAVGLTTVCLLALATPTLAAQVHTVDVQAVQAGRPAHKTTLWIATDRTPLRSERSGEAVVLKELPLGMPVRLLRCEG
ncbi:MAG: hypothetical protein Q8S17_11760, partial [Humidesulfovibrio sp.]|nr:hypothetical protein [Humidesulfovibrio sp.]